jgi:hypothetical protein
VSVDPNIALLVVLHVEVGIPHRGEVEGGSGERGEDLGAQHSPVEYLRIDFDLINFPLFNGIAISVLDIGNSFAIEAHGIVEVDVSHSLNQKIESAAVGTGCVEDHPLVFSCSSCVAAQEVVVLVYDHEIPRAQVDYIFCAFELSLVHHHALVEHLEVRVLEVWRGDSAEGQGGAQVAEHRGYSVWPEGGDFDCGQGIGRHGNFPGDVLLSQVPKDREFLSGRSLFVDGSIVVVGGDVGSVTVVVNSGVGAGGESEVGASVDHVHREGVVVLEEELELFGKGGDIFALEFFAPVREPSAVDLSSKDHAVGLYRPRIDKVSLCDSVVDADIGSIPMAFCQITSNVHIVLIHFNTKIRPNLPQSSDIPNIVAVKTVFVLDL